MANNKPRTSSRYSRSTLAQAKNQERDNNEKVSNTSQGVVPYKNMNMGIHTETTTKAICYEDDIKSNAHVYAYPKEMRYTTDGQTERMAKGAPIIPEWDPVNDSLQDPMAVNRTTQEMHVSDGYSKYPSMHQYSMEDNFNASMVSCSYLCPISSLSSLVLGSLSCTALIEVSWCSSCFILAFCSSMVV